MLALAVGLAGGAGADWSRVRIATEGTYPPWNDIDGSGRLIGFEIDLARDLCERMEVECEFVARDWEGLVGGLVAGQYDAVMSGLRITPERREVIRFSTPYAAMPDFFAVREDGALAGQRSAVERIDLAEIDPAEQAALDALGEAFAGRRVAVPVASAEAGFVEARLGDRVEIQKYPSEDDMVRDLRAGRVDLALASIEYWRPLLAGERGAGLTLVGPGLGGGPFGPGVGVGLRQEEGELAAMFDAAIAAAAADGTLGRLSREWFGFDASP